MTLYPIVYLVIGVMMLVLGFLDHEGALIALGAACAGFGVMDAVLKK